MEGSSRAMLATARHSCLILITLDSLLSKSINLVVSGFRFSEEMKLTVRTAAVCTP